MSRNLEISARNEQGTTKLNFLASLVLAEKLTALAEQLNLPKSEIIRTAIERFIKQQEDERIASEIAEACKFYYDMDKKMAAEWRSAEARI